MIEMDGFDRLPDPLILLIFNSVSDVKTMIRCRSVSKRFQSLVPLTESLLLRVDRVISPDPNSHSLFFAFFNSFVNSLHRLFNPSPHPPSALAPTASGSSPAQFISLFRRIRILHIELPAGDLKLDDGVTIKWRADFGETLKSCVILAFRASEKPGESADFDLARGLKTRVLWTISALIAASARHYLLKEVVREHEEMERLVVKDKEGEGILVMNREGLREFRSAAGGGSAWVREGSRTVVPRVRMRMRHAPTAELKDRRWGEGATLVVVRPCSDGGEVQRGADVEEAEMALGAFGDGEYGDAVRVLLKRMSYLLEMNSF